MKDLTQDTSQLLFRNSFRPHKQLSEAHSASMHNVSRRIEHTGGCSTRYLVPRCRPAFERLCASTRFSPRKVGSKNTTMKTRIGQDLSTKPDARSQSDSSLSPQGRRIRCCLGMLGVALLVMLVNGCASVATSVASDPWQYNPNTGYPAVGGPTWGQI